MGEEKRTDFNQKVVQSKDTLWHSRTVGQPLGLGEAAKRGPARNQKCIGLQKRERLGQSGQTQSTCLKASFLSGDTLMGLTMANPKKCRLFFWFMLASFGLFLVFWGFSWVSLDLCCLILRYLCFLFGRFKEGVPSKKDTPI